METANYTVEYLSSYSEKDAQWDRHRAVVDTVSGFYKDSDEPDMHKLGKRTYECSRTLVFNRGTNEDGEMCLNLQRVFLCHCRLCTVCMWARTRVWRRRFIISLPQIIKYNPSARFLFLTLTLRNCQITDLNKTIKAMSKAFSRLMDRRSVKSVVLGYARSCEVTKSPDGKAHPHFHVLLVVKPSYFGLEYIKHSQWVKLWQESLKVDYEPSVRIEAVKPKSGDRTNEKDRLGIGDHAGLVNAVLEVAKYSTKPSDLVGEPRDKKGKLLGWHSEISHQEWFLELTRQIHGTKHVVLGGILRQYITDEEPSEDEILTSMNDDNDILNVDADDLFFFNWWSDNKKYWRKKQINS